MAVFRMKGNATAHTRFLGGRHADGFLEEEEAGLGVVSPAMQFGICATQGPWVRFAAELEAMCGQTAELGKYSEDFNRTEEGRSNYYRVVICSPVQLNRKKRQIEGQPDVTWAPMIVKLISDIAIDQPRAQREHGFLARLARICGPNNVSLRIEGLNVVNEDQRLQLSWNETNLCWETADPVQMTFMPEQLRTFGMASKSLLVYVDNIEFELTSAGVSKVLQRQYGKDDGDNWKQILESEELSDIQIICGNAKDQPNLKPI